MKKLSYIIVCVILFATACSKVQKIKRYIAPIVIWPNPVTDTLFISGGPQHRTKYEYRIVDLNGVVRQQANVKQIPKAISVSSLQAGILLLIIKDCSNWSDTITFVKMN